jgi:hypothetical protein
VVQILKHVFQRVFWGRRLISNIVSFRVHVVAYTPGVFSVSPYVVNPAFILSGIIDCTDKNNKEYD